MANMLQSLFSGKLPARRPETAEVGSGMAGSARDVILKRQYDTYVQNAMIDGENPLPYDQWLATKGG